MDYEIDKWDIDENDEIFQPLNRKNKKDLKLVNDYCKEHEFMYGNQTCKPIWEWGTGNLKNYEVIVHPNKTAKMKFVTLRDKKKKPKKKKK